MNRSERRKLEQRGVNQAHILQQYRKEAYEAGHKDGMASVVEITFYMVAYTLSYKLDLSKEELQTLMKAIYNNIDSYRTGHLEPQDYDAIVKEMNEEYEVEMK